MAKEAIARVQAAEAEAAAIRERAVREAHTRVEDCERAALRRKEVALEAASAELSERLLEVGRRAAALIEQSREEAEADIEALRESAGARMWEAVKHIEWEVCDI